MRLPGKHARILRHTDGTRHIVTTGVTVGLTTGSEVVTLDGTGKALTNRNTTHVDLLTDSKDIGTNDITSLQGPDDPASTRNSFRTLRPASTPALARCPAAALFTRLAPNTEGHLDRG